MTPTHRIQFNAELEALLKPLLKSLYLKWQAYDAATIHECFFMYVSKRNHEKILKLVNRRHHRKLRYKQLKSELENVRVAQEIKEFEKNL